MQKELGKPSDITPKIQAYIDGLVQYASLKISNKYQSRMTEKSY